ncbi:hypothetical protein ER308_06045 [Egibacter rhizosphaerae]|uniref:SRPBCC family protein n=1 Tax=Egibacter rhizosphaerae TaxID=1670831 RepID=A0A411YD66_9ACTN|nr:hypothetical protein [Egibacter rhizosphaerae]QBI19144.1 hypothetical protein ER308_06045 [Egibacter rhizosphaerae]
MGRHVFQTCPVLGDTTQVQHAFTSDPGTWLPAPADAVDHDTWTIRLTAGPATQSVHATVGAPFDLGEVTWRTIRWQPPEDATLHRFLPAFTGEIGLRAADTGTLVVQGHYAPPGGTVGSAIDTLALHRVADATIHTLVASVAERLQVPTSVA